MFCPNCKAEYRDGFTRCNECQIDLVQSLRTDDCKRIEDMRDDELQEIWSGEDEVRATFICRRLREVEIPFRVLQDRHLFLTDLEQMFRIGVPPAFFGEAEEITREHLLDFTDEQAQRIMELPADDQEHVESDDVAEKWDPQKASVGVWSGQSEQSSKVVSALREVDIRSQTKTLNDGSQKILVMPSDEGRAREIIREVSAGSPPT